MKGFLFSAILLYSSLSIASNPWEDAEFPSYGNTQAIGSYANGCLNAAKPLPLKGEGYQVIRSSRNRFYGHPDMVDYLIRLAKKTKAYGLDDLMIADIAMPRGGRFSSGHASHQTGLDADIWLSFAAKRLPKHILEAPTATSMVDLETTRLIKETGGKNMRFYIRLRHLTLR